MEKARFLFALVASGAVALMAPARATGESARKLPATSPVNCGCPQHPRPLGKSATCEDACFGPEAVEEYENENEARAEKARDQVRKLNAVAEQAQQKKEAALDADAAGAVARLTEENEVASDEELLKEGALAPKRIRSRAHAGASTP